MAEILKGAPAAVAITQDLITRAAGLKAAGVTPCLAILRVGERPEDLAYERGAIQRCEKNGIRVASVVLPADCGQEDLLAQIRAINADAAIHGCLMFRPLPGHPALPPGPHHRPDLPAHRRRLCGQGIRDGVCQNHPGA